MITRNEQPTFKPDTLALVTGGTGVIGPSLIAYLQECGVCVRALILPGDKTEELRSDVDVIRGDIRDPDVVRSASEDVDLIFHLAAKLHINDPDPVLEDEYLQINVEGTRNVVQAAEQQNVGRIVFFSTINVYGTSDGKNVFTEHSPLSPGTYYEISKADAESIVLGAKSIQSGQPLGVVLRLAAIYAPQMKGNYLSLLKALRKGWFLPIGPSQNRRTVVHIDDAVRGACLVAAHPGSAGQVFNLTDGNVYTLMEIIQAMCEAIGRTPPRFHLPIAPVRFMLGLIEDIFKLIGIPFPFGRHTVDLMLEDRAVSGAKIQDELGFQPKKSLVEGWQEIVQVMNEEQKNRT